MTGDSNVKDIVKYDFFLNKKHSTIVGSSELDFIESETKNKLEQGFMISGKLNASILTLIRFLIKLINAKNCLEIGTYTGYTAVAMAEAVKSRGGRVVCVDDFSGEPLSEQICLEALSKCGKNEMISLIKNDGKTALKKLISEKHEFDFCFIDADKESQIFYVDEIFSSGLLSPTGLIVIDNTLWYSRVLADPVETQVDETTKSIMELNEFLINDHRFEVMMLPVRDGLTVIKRK